MGKVNFKSQPKESAIKVWTTLTPVSYTHLPPPTTASASQQLVAAAVGLDANRGDQLIVENVPFDEPIEEPVVCLLYKSDAADERSS